MYSGCYEVVVFFRLLFKNTSSILHTFNTKLMLIPVLQPFGVFGTTLNIQDSHYCGIPFSNVRCIMQKLGYLARMWPVSVTSIQIDAASYPSRLY